MHGGEEPLLSKAGPYRIDSGCMSYVFKWTSYTFVVLALPFQDLRNRCKRMDAAGDEEDQAAELEKTAHQVRDSSKFNG